MPTDGLAAAANQVGQHLLDLAFARPETLDAAVANRSAAAPSSAGNRRRHAWRQTSRASRPARPAGRTAGKAGRPGRAASSQMPGAVPAGLSIGRLPAGNIAWRRLRSGIGRLCRANSARMCASDGFVQNQLDADRLGHRVARQIVGRRSQAAGGHAPGRPGRAPSETPRRWPPDRRPRSCDRATRTPNSPKRWLSHWLLVSSRSPLANSSPMEMISAINVVASAGEKLGTKSARLAAPRSAGRHKC